MLKVILEYFDDDLLRVGSDFSIHQLNLGLAFELRIGMFDVNHRGQPFARVLAGEIAVSVLEKIRGASVVVDDAGDPGPEAGEVCPAVMSINRIREGENRFGIVFAILERDFDSDPVDRLVGRDDRMQRVDVPIEIVNEGGDPALEIEGIVPSACFVDEADFRLLGDERHFAEATEKDFVFVPGVIGKDRRIETERNFGSGLFLRAVADHFDAFLRNALRVALIIDFPAAVNPRFHPFRERVNGGGPDAMKTAGNFIGPAAEFTAGMKRR